jgi:hypothetical protein
MSTVDSQLLLSVQVGFFKRKRPEEMMTYQAEKKHQKKMLEDSEDEEK